MDDPHGKRPGWWDRVQRVMLALVALSGEAAKVVAALRSIVR
jgi:hypothetical protein